MLLDSPICPSKSTLHPYPHCCAWNTLLPGDIYIARFPISFKSWCKIHLINKVFPTKISSSLFIFFLTVFSLFIILHIWIFWFIACFPATECKPHEGQGRIVWFFSLSPALEKFLANNLTVIPFSGAGRMMFHISFLWVAINSFFFYIIKVDNY